MFNKKIAGQIKERWQTIPTPELVRRWTDDDCTDEELAAIQELLIARGEELPKRGAPPTEPFTNVSPVPSSQPSVSQSGGASVMPRYRDAYRVAHTVTAFGATVKIIAFLIGGAFVVAGLVAASQSGMFAIAVIVAAAIVSIPIYILGVIVSAIGQSLKATLDTAVHSSPFLSKAEMREIMSLD